MTDELLIDLTDFVDYKDVSEHMDVDRINTYIRDAQVLDLRLFLGRELYLLMLSDWDSNTKTFTNPIYTALFYGSTSLGVKYYGLQPALVLYTYARIVEDININITRTGVRTFDSEESEPVPLDRIATKSASGRATALAYINDMENYLNANSSDYPTWKNTLLSNTGYPFFKVP